MYAQVHVSICTHAWRGPRSFQVNWPSCAFETGSLTVTWGWSIGLNWLASEIQRLPTLPGAHHCARLSHMGAKGQRSSCLLGNHFTHCTEPAPQPSFILIDL